MVEVAQKKTICEVMKTGDNHQFQSFKHKRVSLVF
jgi:hypothetical protein